jgi:hypothetical protein
MSSPSGPRSILPIAFTSSTPAPSPGASATASTGRRPQRDAGQYAQAVELITELDRWQITLHTGQIIDVWADGYQELDGQYVFGVLATSPEPPHASILVTGRTPTDPSRVIIALARIPIDTVAELHTVPRPTETP